MVNICHIFCIPLSADTSLVLLARVYEYNCSKHVNICSFMAEKGLFDTNTFPYYSKGWCHPGALRKSLLPSPGASENSVVRSRGSAFAGLHISFWCGYRTISISNTKNEHTNRDSVQLIASVLKTKKKNHFEVIDGPEIKPRKVVANQNCDALIQKREIKSYMEHLTK